MEMRTVRVGLSRSAWLLAMLVSAGQTSLLRAQEEGGEEEEPGHDHALALFLGGVTHFGSDADPNESGFAIGLEYARGLTSRLKVGLIAEYATTDAERDFIAALPLFAHLTERFVLVAAPGIEFAVGEEGTETHKETAFLMRFGTIYEVEIDDWIFAPQVHADVVSGQWTLVYGIALGIGF